MSIGMQQGRRQLPQMQICSTIETFLLRYRSPFGFLINEENN